MSVREILHMDQDGQCLYCGIGLFPHEGKVDLRIPVERGGSNEYGNLQLICVPCRSRKGKRTDEEFRERYLLAPPTRRPPRAILPEAYFTNIDRDLARRGQ